MRKVILFIIIMFFLLSFKNKKTLSVFLEEDNIDIPYYIIGNNINTNNFNEYFNSFNIVSISPYINPIYKDKLEINYMYDNIENFKKYYISELKKRGYYIEANKYLVKPIKINKVLVYSNIYDIKRLLKIDNYEIKRCNSCMNFNN